MAEFVSCQARVEMHQHPDAVGHRPGDVELLCTDERDIAQAHGVSRRCRKDRREIACGCEQDRDDIVVGDVVAFQHQLDELHDALGDVFGFIDVEGGCTSECPDGG